MDLRGALLFRKEASNLRWFAVCDGIWIGSRLYPMCSITEEYSNVCSCLARRRLIPKKMNLVFENVWNIDLEIWSLDFRFVKLESSKLREISKIWKLEMINCLNLFVCLFCQELESKQILLRTSDYFVSL